MLVSVTERNETNMKTSDSIIGNAAHMLVSAQVDCIKFASGTDWMAGFYIGRRAAARFVLRHHAMDFGRAGQRRVAAAIRGWCKYFKADFAARGKDAAD